MSKLTTHYDNLKVTRTATPAVIKAAYKALAQEYHPDRNKHPNAARIMQIVNDAYAVLSDPVRREKHDRWIVQEEQKTSTNPRTSEPIKRSDPHLQTQIDRLRKLHRADLHAMRQLHEVEVKALKRWQKFEKVQGIVLGLLISLPLHIIFAKADEAIQRVQAAAQQEHVQKQVNKKEVTMLRH